MVGSTALGTGGSITPTGGQAATGGSSSAAGGTPSTGGKSSTGGSNAATGGKSSTGGNSAATGGKSSTGGSNAATGGMPATGGSNATTGGKSSTGGASTAIGGKSATGGAATGGAATGGAATGGSNGTCTIPTPPNVATGYATGVTGGGSKTPVEVNSMAALVTALTAYKGGTSGLVIRYTGTFNFASITDPCVQFTKDEQTVDIKDMSNVTIMGAPGSGVNFGLHFMRVSNVIIRNMKFGYIPGAGDAIGIEGDSSKFWVDHNEFFSSMVECDGAGDGEFDGLLDIKDGSSNMTFSYNYFHDHHKVGLMGSSDSDTFDWRVTLHHNRYENVGSRLPLQRGGTTHVYNNYYNNVMVTGINVRMNGISLIESNYFENSKNPVTSRDSTAIGYWDLRNNYAGGGITWTTADAPSANANTWATSKAFTGSLGYSYTPDPAACVKAIVLATAGQKLSL